MQKSENSRKALRYRAYFWLMDASLVAVIYGTLDLVFGLTTGHEFSEYQLEPVRSILGAYLAFFILVAPVILICARFMRDEYCEELWRRSFIVLAYLTAIAPLVYLVVYWSLFYGLGQPEPLPPILAWTTNKVIMGPAIYFPWIGYMIMFVLVFQFLRWRDAR